MGGLNYQLQSFVLISVIFNENTISDIFRLDYKINCEAKEKFHWVFYNRLLGDQVTGLMPCFVTKLLLL